MPAILRSVADRISAGETASIPAGEIARFGKVTTIEDYVAQTLTLLPQPNVAAPAVASPLSLVAALDYLDVVWRLQDGRGPLFAFTSAQRTAKLAYPAATEDDFASRLSTLADVLRIATHGRGPARRKDRGRPLAALEAGIVALRPAAQRRIGTAVAALEAVVELRDADQHALAATKRVAAARALGIVYPPTSWAEAWASLTASVVVALEALIEVLSSEPPT